MLAPENWAREGRDVGRGARGLENLTQQEEISRGLGVLVFTSTFFWTIDNVSALVTRRQPTWGDATRRRCLRL